MLGSEGWLSCKQFIGIGCCELLGLSCWWHCVSSLPAHDHVLLSMQISQRETFGKPVAYHSTERPKNTQPFQISYNYFYVLLLCFREPSNNGVMFIEQCVADTSQNIIHLISLCQAANLQCPTAAASISSQLSSTATDTLTYFDTEWTNKYTKVKVKFTLEQATKDQWGSRDIVLLFL